MCRFLMALVVCAAGGVVSADEPSAVAVGKPAPSFTMTGIDGKPVSLAETLEKSDSHWVVVFSRAHWCPYCMGQLTELTKKADDFKDHNAKLLFVFREERDGPAGLKKIKDKTGTEYLLGLDLGKESSQAYSSKQGSFNSYVIDKTGIVRAVLPGTKPNRVTAGRLLAELKKIEGQ